MSRSSSLQQLQAVDLEMDGYRARLEAIARALGADPAVQAAERGLVAAEAELHNARVALKNLEHEAQSLADKISEISERAYGGSVSNPKVLQDLQRDLESLNRRRAVLEEQQFEALVTAEAAETRHEGLQVDLKKLEAEVARQHGTLLEERLKLQASLERLEVSREAALSSVLPADQELYDRLRAAKKGRAVARLEEGACGACGVAPSSSRIQSARQGNSLILCGNCGRILAAD
jgi:predicted  nucleic acid-binding Zn-ribbon protein